MQWVFQHAARPNPSATTDRNEEAVLRGLLPPLMDVGPHVTVVDAPDRRHLGVVQGWKVRGPGIVFHLLDGLATGNGARQRVEHEDPTERKLGHRRASRDE